MAPGVGGVRGSKVFLSATVAGVAAAGAAATEEDGLAWSPPRSLSVWMMSVPAITASNAILMVSFMVEGLLFRGAKIDGLYRVSSL